MVFESMVCFLVNEVVMFVGVDSVSWKECCILVEFCMKMIKVCLIGVLFELSSG